MEGTHKTNPHYLHHQENNLAANIREIVFGIQDGMVSTLGAITGVAIIAVESVSMAIGSYVSSHAEEKRSERVLEEEREEIAECPECEQEEAEELFIRDGWPEGLATQMADAALHNRHLMLREMAYRELGINPNRKESPIKNGIAMFFAYIVGGLIPLSPYFFFPIEAALPISIPVGLLGLFVLGAIVARYTAQRWYYAGARLFVFGSIALGIGFLVGTFVGV